MSRGEKVRGMLCGVLIGCALLCLFFSVFAAAGCAGLAWVCYPPRRKRSGAIAAMFAIIALLFIVLGFVLTATDSDAESVPAKEAALTEAVEITAAPATVDPLDTDLAIFPADVSVEHASTALPLTADILNGSTVPLLGTVFYVDGTVSSEVGKFIDALYLDTDMGEVFVLNKRIVYDGIDIQFYSAHTIPDFGTSGRFFLTYANMPTDKSAVPTLLFGVNEHTITVLATVGEELQVGEVMASPTATPEPQDDLEAESHSEPEPEGYTYIVNTESLKFHKQSCGYAPKAGSANRGSVTGTYQELINWGYSPCGHCLG